MVNEMDSKANIYEIKNIIKKNKLAVYGTGFCADRFSNYMIQEGLHQNVSCYIMTEPDKAEFYGKQVVALKDYSASDETICIAVHKATVDAIKSLLLKNNIFPFLWITPYLNELELGVGTDTIINVLDIMRKHQHDYFIAVRYLAIQEYYGKNNYGYSTYLKYLKLQTADKTRTPDARLDQFKNLIKSWEENGYDHHYPIYIDRNSYLVDGAHRLSLALYHSLTQINCVCYSGLSNKKGENWDSAYLRENVLKFLELDPKIYNEIQITQKLLLQ